MFHLNHSQTLCLLISYSIIYVAPLYAFQSTRPSPNRSRDHPENIKARVRAVSVSTAACSLVTLWLLYISQHDSNVLTNGVLGTKPDPWHLMGYWPVGFLDAAKVVFLTAILFAAPLYEILLIDGGWRSWVKMWPLRQTWYQWTYWRNFVAGPITEECLFRSASIPLLLIAESSSRHIIFLSPLIFGLAHLHHFYEFRLANPHVPATAAIVRSLFQLSFTALFGVYATFLFLRTGSLLGITLVHAFCNAMGLPRVWGRVEPHWFSDTQLKQPNAVLSWTIGYYVLLFGGLFLWWQSLFPLTESVAALIRL